LIGAFVAFLIVNSVTEVIVNVFDANVLDPFVPDTDILASDSAVEVNVAVYVEPSLLVVGVVIVPPMITISLEENVFGYLLIVNVIVVVS